MLSPLFDRSRLVMLPLRDRADRVAIPHDIIGPDDTRFALTAAAAAATRRLAAAIRAARARDAAVMVSFGAHTIKNGLAPVLAALMESGYVGHLATNGAGVIHDWEIAYQGHTSESVRENQHTGRFGLWEETGRYLNLALSVGAYQGLGYGESIGALIAHNGLHLPAVGELEAVAGDHALPHGRRAAAIDLVAAIERADAAGGDVVQAGGAGERRFLTVDHPFAAYSLQCAAYRAGRPTTAHPMFGHDVIYMHPQNCGAAVGRTAERDFLRFAQTVGNLRDGVYISVGSAVMSPMVFEKAFSMAQNIAHQQRSRVDGVRIAVVDLQETAWDWQHDGEPPADNPAYYLRFMKSFARVGAEVDYICADNRAFFPALYRELAG